MSRVESDAVITPLGRTGMNFKKYLGKFLGFVVNRTPRLDVGVVMVMIQMIHWSIYGTQTERHVTFNTFIAP